MASIFDKIISGEIPAYKIGENENYLAFLDIMPLKKGHTLVIPKMDAKDKIFELSRQNYQGLMDFSYTIAQAIENAVDCKRVSMAVLGLEVPYAHVHLVPVDVESDLRFSNPRQELSPKEFAEVAKQISQQLEIDTK